MELPSNEALTWLVSRYAALRAEHAEVLEDLELVLPTGECFPDPFEHDPPSVARLLARMLAYAPLDEELEVGLRFLEPDAETGAKPGGGCGSGACGTSAGGSGLKDNVVPTGEGYLVEVPIPDVANATLLTTGLARAVGAIVLAEAGEEPAGADAGALAEVTAVACGFGPLLLEGAYVYGKSCGGVRVHQATRLPIGDLAVLTALFVRVQKHKPGRARGPLSTTQTEAFDLALSWVDSNEAIVEGLRDNPAPLAAGLFDLQPVRGLLGRWLGRREPKLDAPPSRPRRERTPDEQRRLDEARALVDEALGEPLR